MQSTYLTARETAERRGIKRDTLYAYVSRGLLHSVAVPGSRERGYRAEDVERLRSGRGLSRAARNEPLVAVVGSSICLIEGGRLYYRGHDAIRLAETATLEEIADLLWSDEHDRLQAPTPTLPRLRGRELKGAAAKTLPRKRGREARHASGGRVGAAPSL